MLLSKQEIDEAFDDMIYDLYLESKCSDAYTLKQIKEAKTMKFKIMRSLCIISGYTYIWVIEPTKKLVNKIFKRG